MCKVYCILYLSTVEQRKTIEFNPLNANAPLTGTSITYIFFSRYFLTIEEQNYYRKVNDMKSKKYFFSKQYFLLFLLFTDFIK